MKLAIITTHPIQYYAPVFRMLSDADKLAIRVFYTRGRQEEAFDKGFGKKISWDIPLLDGYDYTFLNNTAKEPGSHHFRGIINPTLIREVEIWGAEAVLVYGWSYQAHFSAMHHFKGRIPVYFRGDSHLLDEQKGMKTVLRRLVLRWVYCYVDYVFYVGTNNKEYFMKHGLKEDQLIFAPHAVDNERFRTPIKQKAQIIEQWKKKIDVGLDQKIILFCGKFENKKDPLLLMQVAKLWANRADVIFLFVGNGHLESQMRAMSADLSNVRFMEFQNQSQMPLTYRLGDIFVLPSQGPGETWGLAVNEAMASGLPVVVSDKVGCAQDLVVAGVNGYTFKAKSVIALNQVMKKLIDTDLHAMGIKSQELINDWSFSLQASIIEKNMSQ